MYLIVLEIEPKESLPVKLLFVLAVALLVCDAELPQ